jgi:5'-methylthioadenosine phosphorylase
LLSSYPTKVRYQVVHLPPILTPHLLLSAGPVHIAVIGGTGLDTLPGFKKAAVLGVDTPWGKPSSDILVLEHPSPTTGQPIPIAFLARHGPHHELTPSEVPSRANMAALRKIGVRCVVAFSAAGSLAEEVKPRDFVVPDQAIDRTKGIRAHTFFEGGFVCHVPFADPFDKKVGDVVRRCGHSLEGEGVRLHDAGTVVVMGKYYLKAMFCEETFVLDE